MDFSSSAMRQYDELREKIAAQMEAADTLLRRCASALPEFEPPQLTPLGEKLRQDRFNLVLTGGFQNGKSTLFSYLCGGRELSPIGPGNGGTPTSAARIVALPVQEGGAEYAIVRWRTPDELLASLGEWVVPHYMQARHENGRINSSWRYVTTEDIDLDCDEARHRLADIARKALENPGQNAMIIDQARMALLIAWFYPDFREAISQPERAQRYDSLETVIRLSSYPRSWQQRWKEAHDSNWQSGFTRGDVSFVFIHSVEYHIDSARLRQLGCCLIDSPGLSASKWDSDIAAQCMRESDAILYLFSGDKSISVDDCNNVSRCTEAGSDDKIFFGANLRMSAAQWQENKRESLQVLDQQGYQNPPFYDFHAGLALRTSELCALDSGCLSLASAAAIDRELEAADCLCNDDNRRMFLEGTLGKFLSSFTQPNLFTPGKTLADFKRTVCDEVFTDYNALEELSGIPAFVKSVRRQILARKKKSLLRRKGSGLLVSVLDETSKLISKELETLQKQRNGGADNLEELEKEYQKFEAEMKKVKEGIHRQIKQSAEDLSKLYCKKLQQALEDRKTDIIGLTTTNFVGPYDNLGSLKEPWAPANAEIIVTFNNLLIEQLRGALHQLCRVIANEFCQTEAYKMAARRYESLCEAYDDKQLPRKLVEHVGADNNAARCNIKGWGGDIMENIRQGNVSALLWSLLPGMNSNWERAENAVNQVWDTILEGMKEVLDQGVLYRKDEPKGPLQQMWDTYSTVASMLDDQVKTRQLELHRAREAARATAAQLDSRIHSLNELQAELEKMQEASRQLDILVNDELVED